MLGKTLIRHILLTIKLNNRTDRHPNPKWWPETRLTVVILLTVIPPQRQWRATIDGSECGIKQRKNNGWLIGGKRNCNFYEWLSPPMQLGNGATPTGITQRAQTISGSRHRKRKEINNETQNVTSPGKGSSLWIDKRWGRGVRWGS